jgi:gamma-glutamyltranspeptidase/glutathione hydrolase
MPAPVLVAQAPESATGYAEKAGWVTKQTMIAAANPLATAAGYQMLHEGGSAVDAAVATQLVLGLVEPQSSGIGGGAFMMYFDAHAPRATAVKAFDGRETAPAAATGNLFRTPEGKAMDFYRAVIGGRSVGAPGALRMLETAHRQYGRLPWAKLFEPAIRLAEQGFAVSPRLHELIKTDPYLKNDPVAAGYFYDERGEPRPVGYIMKNPALAKSLREIAAGGADAFYRGHIAADIEAKIRHHPVNPGLLTAADIAAYQPKLREPVCSDYKLWTVCGMPPPSSGGIAIAQMLGILEHTDIERHAPKDGQLDPEGVHLIAEAGRLAFADRGRYVADTDFVPLPGNSIKPLIDKRYLAQRASLLSAQSMGKASPGDPAIVALGRATPPSGDDTSPEFPCTSHIVIVDSDGNALSMTTTVEDAFGSRQMVDGFMLNNQLTDFSFDAVDANGPIANRVEPGKRPRSSMSPTLVFDRKTGQFVMAVGSAGGSFIINHVAKVLVATLDWGLNMQQAISLPNFGSRNGPTELEEGRASPELAAALRAKGHNVRMIEDPSGLQGIMRMDIHGVPMWFGGADPRREGDAKGD